MLPLERYRMLDLSRLLPGPVASHILADMGMDVVKVEEPKPRYGMGRDILTPSDPTPEEEERHAAYNSLARNKRSIALDLLDPAKRPQSQEVFYSLAKKADVVLEGYRPGVVNWMGIDYETLRKHSPKIIMCSIAGYGQVGPYIKWPGHDMQFSGVGGSTPFDKDDRPVGFGTPLADYSSGMYAATAILAALIHRDHTGEGQYIDVPMVASAMSFNLTNSANHFRDKGKKAEPARRGGASLTYLQCKDGKWLTTGNAETTFWENFCKVLGHQEWVALRRSAGLVNDRMIEDIQKIFLTKSRKEWLEILVKAETCVAPVNDMEESFQDPQIREIGMVWEMRHPKEGLVPQMGFPVRFSKTPAIPRTFAPLLGQHTRELLKDAGYSDGEVAGFEKSELVKSWKG